MSLAGEERKLSIMNLLNEYGKVTAADLARMFEVTSETIRRDLDELEKDNKLKKVYGGAIKPKTEAEPTLVERSCINQEAKEKIGYLAFTLIDDHDVIFLDEGTTPLQMIPYIGQRTGVTVLTSSISAMMALIELQKREQFDGKIIMLGGVVSAKHLRVSGAFTEAGMSDLFVNKAFVTVDALSVEHGFTSYDYEKAVLTRKWIQQCDLSVVLADSSKWNKRSLAKICGFDNVDVVISELEPPEEWKDRLEQSGTRWMAR
ncbi:DeoR/GlpR family DNA-binding transcription regulator [Paenibacillus sp. MMS20-IR301]|uniref:DeoR/GlpR family DNA-binding transcription regulator n=1 Tax=Paenibacillus sp. MMS20-IR301 TaxID=2895946 RepID=UPI0028EBE134|nr:DeoR/GlpR family DNA-binding transcription regulator [Paenibacillus sp. MMS20-IR301]WNS42889.1 DeoR/GlpR family DNA-binding transcription regulator [Paenibacillus sp. MMS20-IR301]